MSELPELPLEPWEATKETLHLWTQIVGKVRLASTPPQNHWWNAPLLRKADGLGRGVGIAHRFPHLQVSGARIRS